jgi:hypothetical protein
VYGDASYADTVKELKVELDRLRAHYGVPEDTAPAEPAKKPAKKKAAKSKA